MGGFKADFHPSAGGGGTEATNTAEDGRDTQDSTVRSPRTRRKLVRDGGGGLWVGVGFFFLTPPLLMRKSFETNTCQGGDEVSWKGLII